ncbi:uncharacterized protein LOC132204250 isoform X2 [Neocloeon triangulifer]|uniref:uncharacterized protein LOC132204250 isoform X2 n=1 Tax=Neocloeon triangulifer TaxID=2078957 RepID=UPI00286F45CA|nr:uncharacterized protein LOC132204250 isoform X2 [Neocloeon triangulifer]
MPLRANLLLFLLIAAHVHQYNGNPKKKLGRRNNFPKVISKRMHIIKCCGLKSCVYIRSRANSRTRPDNLGTQVLKNVTVKSEILTTGFSTEQTNFTEDISDFPTTSAVTDTDLPIISSDSNSPKLSDIPSTLETTELFSSPIPSVDSTIKFATIFSSESLTNSDGRTTIANSVSNTTSVSSTTIITPSIKTTTSLTTNAITTTIDPSLVGTCRTETNAAVNRSLFASNGALADPNLHGFWLDACGQTLLLGKSMGTWHENSAKCFSLKMQPFAFESKVKLECMKVQATSWRFNLNYWTGGTKDPVNDTLGWCFANGTVPWKEIPPLANLSKGQNCVQMQISKFNGTISMMDRRCSDRLIFACQSSPTKSPKCTGPLCPDVACQRNPSLFTPSANNSYLVLKDHTQHGLWFSRNLRHYLFSFQNDSRTYFEATKACCSLGMSLLSLDGSHKYEALASIYADSTDLKQGTQNLTFWTSGSDEGCESIFGFCTAKRLFRNESRWLPGQPDNAEGKENYVAVQIKNGQALLADYQGETKFRYICEIRRNPQSKSGLKAIIDECAVVYNVTEHEIDLLQNVTSFDSRMKCFVKLFGDSTGLLVGGKIVENEVFANLETTQNEIGLITNMAIVDECNNKTYGMDDCDKAYQLAKCARDKAPVIFDQVIKDLQAADSGELISMAYGCANTCDASSINAVEKNSIDSVLNTLNASTCSFADSRYWLCKCNDSKKYIVFFRGGLVYDYYGATTFCCERGMRLISALNYMKSAMCLKAPLANESYSINFYTILNAVVIDATSGFSYDCGTKTEFHPKMMHPNYIARLESWFMNSAGPIVAYSSLIGAVPEFALLWPNHKEVFICEEI